MVTGRPYGGLSNSISGGGFSPAATDLGLSGTATAVGGNPMEDELNKISKRLRGQMDTTKSQTWGDLPSASAMLLGGSGV